MFLLLFSDLFRNMVLLVSCPICLDSDAELFKQENCLMVMKCGHTTCRKCVTEMARKQNTQLLECPLCRFLSPFSALKILRLTFTTHSQ